jgi:alpha-galactosidase
MDMIQREQLPHQQYAATPPMGWNSWDCYGASVTEEEVLGNARYMAEQLKPYGWEYVVVDIQWYEPGANSSAYRPFVPLAMDGYSRLIPAENRFPSSAGGKGFKPLADAIHAMGLKFGIHIMRGIPRQAVHANTPVLGTSQGARDIALNNICPWNSDMYGVNPKAEGAQAYYDSLFQLYAEWEVDFVKVDDIAASRLYHIHTGEIEMLRKAIDRCGRPMVLSLSPGAAPLEHSDLFLNNANMWRMTDDFWDLWPLLHDMFERCEKWYPIVGDGSWPDCDMLPLGHIGLRSVDGGGSDRLTRFTKDEQLTMMTLWSVFRSPLMFGGELRDNDEWTLSLLTNEEVLAVHRDGRGAKPLYRDGERSVWTSTGPSGELFAALFNLGDAEAEVTATWEQLGLQSPKQARDLWNRRGLGTVSGLGFLLPPHGSMLVKLV